MDGGEDIMNWWNEDGYESLKDALMMNFTVGTLMLKQALDLALTPQGQTAIRTVLRFLNII
jgi:hypothetical protein